MWRRNGTANGTRRVMTSRKLDNICNCSNRNVIAHFTLKLYPFLTCVLRHGGGASKVELIQIFTIQVKYVLIRQVPAQKYLSAGQRPFHTQKNLCRWYHGNISLITFNFVIVWLKSLLFGIVPIWFRFQLNIIDIFRSSVTWNTGYHNTI